MKFESLEHPIRWLFLFHALAGALALGVLVIPLLSKKGSKLHVRAGWLYSFAMIFIGLSAFVMTPWRAFYDPSRSQSSIGFSVFLFYIAVFTLTALWYGIKVLKLKNRASPVRGALYVGPPVFLIVLGLAVQILGFTSQNYILMLFPFLGHLTAKQQLTYWRSSPSVKMHWWYEHMNGMFTACIATITAFLVTALPRIYSSSWSDSPILWTAPGLILGTALNRWTDYYRKK